MQVMTNMNLIKKVRITGKGEQILVLSHGYGGSESVWDNVVPYLFQKYQILLFDWNFSGSTVDDHAGRQVDVDSSKHSFSAFSDDLISLMDKLSIREAVFVGHSMACMVGCIASIRRPDLFSQLVLIGGSPRYLNSEDYEGGFEIREIEHMLSQMEHDFLTWADSFVALVIGVNDPISIEKLGKSFKSMNPQVAVSLARTIFLGDMRDILEKVNVHCTIIQISNDFVVPISVGRYMLSKMMKGRASLEIIDSDGHFPQLTAPLKLLEILDRTLINVKEAVC